MQQRAEQQQHVRQRTEHMRTMLGEQEKSGDGEEPEQRKPGARAPEGWRFFGMIVVHRVLLGLLCKFCSVVVHPASPSGRSTRRESHQAYNAAARQETKMAI